MTLHRMQLREAKQRLRHRDRAAGYARYRIDLPADLRERLEAGMREECFVERLHEFLRRELVPVADYPTLELLCWNLKATYITRKDAFALYERNWRWVDIAGTSERERAFIMELAGEFGRGLINA